MNAPSTLRTLGPAAATTVAAVVALTVGTAIGGSLAWATVTDDPRAAARTIVEAAVLVTLICMVEIVRRLRRECRRQP